MEVLALTSGLLFALAGLVVAIRLLALARRTHGLPEILIAAALLSGGLGVGIFRAMVMHAPLSDGLLSAVELGVHFCRGITIFAIALVAWRVFAPNRLWASTLAGTILLGTALVLVGEVREMRPPTATDHPLYWAWCALLMVSFGWGSWESLRYHAKLRRRMPLGLADPVVANRILLWGIASGCVAIQAMIVVASTVLGGADLIPPGLLAILSGLSCLAAAAVWLAFFPPKAYLERVRARAVAARS
jgi:hypothetical protein